MRRSSFCIKLKEKPCRVMVLYPEKKRKPALVLFLPGHNCARVEKIHAYQRLLEALVLDGFSVMYLEQDDPLKSFRDEISACVKALEEFCSLYASATGSEPRFFLFGHSTGGILAPCLAREVKTAGIAVFGAGAEKWVRYEIENTRTQWELAQCSRDCIERRLQDIRQFIELFYHRKQTPAEIRAGSGLGYLFQGEEYQGRHYTYWQEIGELDLEAIWQEADTEVLALWGEADYLSAFYGHELTYQSALKAGRKNSMLLRIPAMDHYFRKVESPCDSYRNNIESKYNDALEQPLLAWYNRLACLEPSH